MKKVALHLSTSILDKLTELGDVHAPGNTIRNEEAVSIPITLNKENRRTEVIHSKGRFYKKALQSQFLQISDKLNITHGMSVCLIEEDILHKIGMRPDFIITEINKGLANKPENIMNTLSSKSDGVLIEGLYSNGKRHYYGIDFR